VELSKFLWQTRLQSCRWRLVLPLCHPQRSEGSLPLRQKGDDGVKGEFRKGHRLELLPLMDMPPVTCRWFVQGNDFRRAAKGFLLSGL